MKYREILSKSFLYIFTFFGVINIVYGLFWLKTFNNVETNIEDNVVTRFSVPTEYQNKDSFWWLLGGKNIINIINFSTEKHSGNLILRIANNPCKSVKNIYFQNQKFDFQNNEIVEISTNFTIEPLKKNSIILIVSNEDRCLVNNGDQRNFGVKVLGWVIK